MIIYESNLTQRKVGSAKNLKPNSYLIHQFVESHVAGNKDEGDKVRSNYVFDSFIDPVNSDAHISVRTISPTGLPGERRAEYYFEEGQVVTFSVHFIPSRHLTSNNKHEFINDSIDRELKITSTLELKGLDVAFLEEQSLESRFFSKPKAFFQIKSARYTVEAKVTDPSLFEQAVAYGVGRKASLGYGKITFIGD